MAASLVTAALRPGSLPTSSALRTASSPSTGTSSRTKQRKPNPQAGCRCSATASPPDHSATHCDEGAQSCATSQAPHHVPRQRSTKRRLSDDREQKPPVGFERSPCGQIDRRRVSLE